MRLTEIRGLLMAICGVTTAIYAASNVDGFIGLVMVFGGAMMTREGYDWWVSDIEYSLPKEIEDGKDNF